jgi:hypothetical protein
VEPSVLGVEVELCLMEWSVEFSVSKVPNLIRRYGVEGVRDINAYYTDSKDDNSD